MARDLAKEIVKAFETGVNRYLDRSIIYSPFRLFYNLFKKSNPNLMEQVRQRIRNDIDANLRTIENYNEDIFVDRITITPVGKLLLQSCYNLGTYTLKKRLTVMMAFKLVRNAELRNEVYNDVLEGIVRITDNLINKRVSSSQATENSALEADTKL